MSVNPAIAFQFANRHPTAAARVLERLPLDDITTFFNGLSATRAAPILAAMPVSVAAASLADMTTDHAAAILRAIPFQNAVRLLRLVAPAPRATLLSALPASRARQINHALQLAPNSVGAWTDGSQPAFARARKVAECLDILKTSRARAPQAIYVVDDHRHVLGELHLLDLVRAPRDTLVADLKLAPAATLPATLPVASAALDKRWATHDVLAVTARSGELIGGFSHRDLIRSMASLTGATPQSATSDPVLAGLVGAYLATLEGLTGTLLPDAVPAPSPGRPHLTRDPVAGGRQ